MTSFDPNKSFLELPIVINTAAFMFAVSVLIALIILVNLPNKTLLLTYEGFNNLLVILRTPLSITALLIPIIAIYAANHRSAQTKKQMELTNNQISISLNQVKIATDNNTFTNRFKHADEFDKYLSDRSSGATIKFTMPRVLHGKLYPGLIRGDLTMDSAPIKSLEAGLEKLIDSADFDPQSKNFIEQITSFENVVDDYCRRNDLSLHKWDKNFVDGIRQPPQTTKELFVPLKSIAQIVVAAASFDGDECLGEKTKALFSLNLAIVMDSKIGISLRLSLSNILDTQ